MALKRPNIKVVWVRWFLDCIAQWRRLPEDADYMIMPKLHPPSPGAGPSTTPPDASVNDTVAEGAVQGAEAIEEDVNLGPVEAELAPMDDVDWGEAEQELEDWMNESGDEGDGDSKTDDESWDGSNAGR